MCTRYTREHSSMIGGRAYKDPPLVELYRSFMAAEGGRVNFLEICPLIGYPYQSSNAYTQIHMDNSNWTQYRLHIYIHTHWIHICMCVYNNNNYSRRGQEFESRIWETWNELRGKRRIVIMKIYCIHIRNHQKTI